MTNSQKKKKKQNTLFVGTISQFWAKMNSPQNLTPSLFRIYSPLSSFHWTSLKKWAGPFLNCSQAVCSTYKRFTLSWCCSNHLRTVSKATWAASLFGYPINETQIKHIQVKTKTNMKDQTQLEKYFLWNLKKQSFSYSWKSINLLKLLPMQK